jgi:hypothetical protein
MGVIPVRSQSSRPRAALCLLVSVALLGGCGAGASPAPASASASPDFTLEVVPDASVGMTIGGQQVVFLVTAGGSEADGAVELEADAAGATITIEPQPLPPGVVGEVSVVPAAVDTDTTLEVWITARRGDVERTQTRTLTMFPGEDGLGEEATQHLDAFVAWLAASRPELGIDDATTWESTPGSWVLVVNHYLFFSADWEVDLAWHVMIAPDDWSRIQLRHRWTEAKPSLAFEISSVSGGSEPREIAPDDAVWR